MDDLRHGIVALRKNRSFAVAAILSLALGIGANTTIFTFINAIFLQPLPVRDPARLASLVMFDSRLAAYQGYSYPNYRDYRDRAQSFSSLLIYSSFNGSLTDRGEPQPLTYQIVSANFFETLGVPPALGRGFRPEEDTPGGAQLVAVISHGLWLRFFGGDARALGQTLGINGNPYQIVGVAPPGFQGLNLLTPVDVWIPVETFRRVYPKTSWLNARRQPVFTVIGRLKPGITRERAGAEVQSVGQDLLRLYPRDNEGRRPKLVPITESEINVKPRATLARSGSVLIIISGLILLIACANVANLLLARAAGRNKEIAIRVALGANRLRLIRQLLTESMVLALTGGALGLLLARWATRILWNLRPPAFRLAVFHLDLDGRVLAFTLLLSVATGIVFGLVPALRATRPDLASDLKERSSQPGAGMGRRHPRSVLVASEVALCIVSLIGAGLFIRSLMNAEGTDPGFAADRLGTVSFEMSDRNYTHPQGREFQRRVLERAAQVPGVVSVALSRDPMFRVSFSQTVLLEDDPNPAAGYLVLSNGVTPNYFRTAGIPLLRGRDFSPLDTEDSPRVAVVNEEAAARFWPSRDPVGQRVRFLGVDHPLEIVGIVRNATYRELGERPLAMFYTSMLQEYDSPTTLLFRTDRDPQLIEPAVRREVQSLDRDLLLRSATVRSVVRGSLWAPRLSAALLGVFGILGLVLATLGVYGVVSYSVNQRVREIGVRMALGASAADIQRLVLRQAMAVVSAGVVVGLLVALAASRAVQSMLFVTSARDALTFVLVPSLLVLAATAACWIPAYRATRIDPSVALRDE